MSEKREQASEIYADQLLRFSLPRRGARGRILRLDATLDSILAAHDYPAPVKNLLAEALVLCALMGGLLKNDGQLTMQAQTSEGIVRLLVCDFRDGEMRGYAEFDKERLSGIGANPTLFALFGTGYLAVTLETGIGSEAAGQRYQGIVPLEGDSLSEACERYFIQSEQIPTLIRTAVRSDAGGCYAAGILLQHLPEGEEGRERLHVRLDHPDWEHVAIIGGTVGHAELLNPALSMEAIVWRLYHEEDQINVLPGNKLSRGCRCSLEHYSQILGRFPAHERDEMRNDEGKIVVDCAFCSREFEVVF